MRLLKAQQEIAQEHLDKRIFVEGMAGVGKTTSAIERIKHLIRQGTPASQILLIVPQATLALPYRQALRRARIKADTTIKITTIGKLSYEIVDLFFPLVAEQAGFKSPNESPHFLSLELAQYYMMRHINPIIEQNDYFNSLHITRPRLFTQIIDNLNKTALVGFPLNTIEARLAEAWRGDPAQKYVYQDAQDTALTFRQVCLDHNLLDFSLQIHIFANMLWKLPQVRDYVMGQYRHLIIENIEEDAPATHDIVRDWLDACESALVLYDSDSGYRQFLGADPIYAYGLKDACDVHITLEKQRTMSKEVQVLHEHLAVALRQKPEIKMSGDPREAIAYDGDNRFHLQMIDWIVEQVRSLIENDGVSPDEIVILAPYLPDALRFAIQTRLDEHNIANRAHRPSRSLREEPASRMMITLAKLAHPQWKLEQMPSVQEVATALTFAISELDLVRGRLLSEVLYRKGSLHDYDGITNQEMQGRITFELGESYQKLVDWLRAYQEDDALPLDIFMSKCFGELLSQPAFGFHTRPDTANVVANLIDSARGFRQALEKTDPNIETSKAFIELMDAGILANQYVRDWDMSERTGEVLLAPAYTFLVNNTPVDYQFWVNIGSSGWSQRLFQPLTHPYVMSRQWEMGRVWTDEDERHADEQVLAYLALGLIRRCRKKIYLGLSQFSEQGYEQRGDLLLGIQRLLRRLNRAEGEN